jgi:hypothetical protein
MAAWVIFAVTACINLLGAQGAYKIAVGKSPPFHGAPSSMLGITPMLRDARFGLAPLPANARFLLLGDDAAFYFPDGSVYATPFDSAWLTGLLEAGKSDEQIMQDLQARGITHIWVSWRGIWGLSQTVGYPSPLSVELFNRYAASRSPSLPILSRLEKLGLRRLEPKTPIYGTFRPALIWKRSAPGPDWPGVEIFAMPAAKAESENATTKDSRQIPSEAR